MIQGCRKQLDSSAATANQLHNTAGGLGFAVSLLVGVQGRKPRKYHVLKTLKWLMFPVGESAAKSNRDEFLQWPYLD